MSLLRCNKFVIEVLMLPIELFTFENAVLNEELSILIESNVLETFNTDALIILIELKILVSLLRKVVHIFETLIQQVFK